MHYDIKQTKISALIGDTNLPSGLAVVAIVVVVFVVLGANVVVEVVVVAAMLKTTSNLV